MQSTVPQPSLSEWRFIEDLKTPLHSVVSWRRRSPKKGEANLSGGVSLRLNFPDPSGVLITAREDLVSFFKAGAIPLNGPYGVRVERDPALGVEAYRLEATREGCRISAGDTEGVRRAMVFLEDEILRTGGPFLPLGRRERAPVIRTRISRCFFSPIKRPPMNRDELTDEMDYYPDEYLNRLAHESINALWLTIKFSDLCPSKFFPDFGRDRERRLRKLRDSVARCARYGIRIYVFCIEPQGFGTQAEYSLPMSHLEGHESLRGNRLAHGANFCTSSREGQAFLEESAEFLFSQVPGLGGLIDIHLGERPTHCYSSTESFFRNTCPRCSRRKPWEVFADTTSALARGMHRANPEAELVSWLYVPYMEKMDATKPILRDIAAHVPREVTLQVNFESCGVVEQLGKKRLALDYWLAWPGPSDLFADCARNAVAAGARMSAKIQVGCSHEVATIPFIPVPGHLYRKYLAMHELGVSTVMQCWYFGNYPGLMNKAAGELSFAPLEETEEPFLLRLAAIFWAGHEKTVVRAWTFFQRGYANFPVNLPFTWYGPLHNSVVWPLHLFPVDRPISPSWRFSFPEDSGDRIGECLSFGHTLKEALVLLRRMDTNWRKGLALLRSLRKAFLHEPDRLQDIGLAEAIGHQIRSAYNVYRFYDLREKLPGLPLKKRLSHLRNLRRIVCEEIGRTDRMIELCQSDARLGFHSEAEGYKYFPAKLAWRKERLQDLLRTDFPALRKTIRTGGPVFPEYTGVAPEGKVYRCPSRAANAKWEPLAGKTGRWKAHIQDRALVVTVQTDPREGDSQVIEIEPRRLWPVMKFEGRADGTKKHHNKLPIEDDRWTVTTRLEAGRRTTRFTLPFALFQERNETKALRCNVYTGSIWEARDAWIPGHPLPSRLFFGTDNPADLGWIVFEPPAKLARAKAF